MKDQQQQQSQNTAITSGAAMGGGGAGPTGPAAQNQWDGGGLGGRGLTEAGVFKEKEFGKGFSLQVLTGAGGLIDGARGSSMFQKFFDAFEGKDGWFKNTMGGGNSSGGGEGGGESGSNRPHSAVGGAAAGAAAGGMTGGGNVPMSSLGTFSPPSMGAGSRGQSGPGLGT